ncbi:acyl-CoA-binding protein homolog [Ixodes scapularis]|uniref:acyl-CoA-binding protein homolog n=1 Tax=Ixodes scapularis TaxID=6945 RepID=UPI001161982F|nr:acyl-CoA-binding protein homolog [Ixodes scapularis]
MSLDEQFNKAAEQVKELTERPSDEELLELYGLFKQANFGDNTTSQPGMFDPKGRAKWAFWNKKKGLTQDAAKEEYIKYVKTLMEKHKK